MERPEDTVFVEMIFDGGQIRALHYSESLGEYGVIVSDEWYTRGDEVVEVE
jgi:hypothetical protein